MMHRGHPAPFCAPPGAPQRPQTTPVNPATPLIPPTGDHVTPHPSPFSALLFPRRPESSNIPTAPARAPHRACAAPTAPPCPPPRDRACAFPLNRRHLKSAHARLPRGCAITFVCACAAAVRSDFSYLRMRGLAWRQRMRSPALLETRRLRTFDRGSAFPVRMRLIGSVFVLHAEFKGRGRRGNGACALIPPIAQSPPAHAQRVGTGTAHA